MDRVEEQKKIWEELYGEAIMKGFDIDIGIFRKDLRTIRMFMRRYSRHILTRIFIERMEEIMGEFESIRDKNRYDMISFRVNPAIYAEEALMESL